MRRFNKILTFVLVFTFCFNLISRADEGMWVPTLINKNYEAMKKLGLKLSVDDIYNINKSSLKDAIVQFGNGCTGEIVSSEGLLFTNHHCGFGQIQAHSTVEHDYLTDGFWAMSRAEELPNPGLSVKFLVRMEDVTSKIMGEIASITNERDRMKKVQELSRKISDEAVAGTHYDAFVRPYFDGNQYYLFVYEIFKDVRLVGTPPSSIGKFGGDTDNWMWPRHTGDFCVFRVYMGPDGKPAEYSTSNIPLKPKHYLPVSTAGIKKDDFAMILGFPGRTNRYLSSFGVQQAIEITNPTTVKIRDKKIELLRYFMQKDPVVRIKYASKYARTSNYWKYYIGQTKQLKQLNVIDKKIAIEKDFEEWVNADTERKKTYGNVLNDLKETWAATNDVNLVNTYVNEAFFGVDINTFANQFSPLFQHLRKNDTSVTKLNAMVENLKVSTEAFFKDYDLETDKKIFSELMQLYFNDVKAEYQPSFFGDIKKNFKSSFVVFADYAYRKSIFTDKAKVLEFLKNPTEKVLSKDPIYSLLYSVSGSYRKFNTEIRDVEEKQIVATRTFMKGLLERNADKNYYPNANSTMRLTYGTVQDYEPRDAVEYEFFTTTNGILEKEDDASLEFVVPKRLSELIRNKDFGGYDENGVLTVCFTTNNDITGGNSGSPVLNDKGELIGIAFDGNWEAMSGDIAFEPEFQRTIIVDARYVLFIIDKFAGASHLVKEMTLVK
jgi:hypothetical protein